MDVSYLLDTNAWAQYLNRRDSMVAQRIERIDPSEVLLCSIVKAELYYGAYRSTRQEANLLLLARLFARFISLAFDDKAADSYGRTRSDLARLGTPIGPNDLMIAAIVLTNDLTLVTHNTREFSRVKGLRIEDWQEEA